MFVVQIPTPNSKRAPKTYQAWNMLYAEQPTPDQKSN
jgi:hypothetical protein